MNAGLILLVFIVIINIAESKKVTPELNYRPPGTYALTGKTIGGEQNLKTEPEFGVDLKFSGYASALKVGASASRAPDGKTRINYEGGYDYAKSVSEKIDLGLGYEFHTHWVKMDNGDILNFWFEPLYGTMIWHLNDERTSFAKMNLGYALYDDDYSSSLEASGGLYYSLGGGIKLGRNKVLGAMYSVYNANQKYTAADIDFDIKYSNLTLSISFLF